MIIRTSNNLIQYSITLTPPSGRASSQCSLQCLARRFRRQLHAFAGLSLRPDTFSMDSGQSTVHCRTNVVHPSKYGVLAERCFSMLRAAARLNIITELDCPLPLCFFNESQLAWISQYHPGTASRIGCCEPVLDVTPELEVIRCFALSDLGV